MKRYKILKDEKRSGREQLYIIKDQPITEKQQKPTLPHHWEQREY